MKNRTDSQSAADDELAAGFHDLLLPEELVALSDIGLLSSIEDAGTGSQRRKQLEREWERRGLQTSKPADAKPHHASQEAANPPDKSRDWTDKPLGKIAVPVLVAILVLLVGYMFKTHLGISP